MSDTTDTLRELLTPFLPDGADAVAATKPIADLGLESVQIMEFVVEVEDHYDIAIDLDSLANAHTLADLSAVVERLRA
ncbi:MAG: acyl carrier protein [Pseudomonadota bacterium]